MGYGIWTLCYKNTLRHRQKERGMDNRDEQQIIFQTVKQQGTSTSDLVGSQNMCIVINSSHYVILSLGHSP